MIHGSIILPKNLWNNAYPTGDLPSRYLESMVYIPQNNTVFLFGGESDSGTILGDSWLYNINENSWTELNLNINPPARESFGLVYRFK